MKLSLFAASLLTAATIALPALGQSGSVVDIMEQSIRTSPSVFTAEADLDRASATASRIASGPYEFEVNASGGQRRMDNPLASESRYTEWAAGVSRTIRLPGKKRIDQDLARIETDLAGSTLDQALHLERREFAMLWSEWRSADLLRETSSVQAEEALRIAELEQVAVDKGAERQIRADQLAAAAALLQLQADQDRSAAEVARAALTSRYPDIAFPARPIPLELGDSAIAGLLDASIERMPAWRNSQLVAEQARLQAQRARLEKTPDPTLGLEFTNEFGGAETSIMARVTIPIGGSTRRAYAREMSASAAVADLHRVRVERDFYQAIESARQSLSASTSLHQKALETASASANILAKIRKGYELGEITVTEFLTARRSQIAAERTVAEQRGKLESDLLNLIALTGGQINE